MTRRRFLTRTLAIVVAVVTMAAPGLGQRMPHPLDPETYSSASGRYKLLVDPSHRYGEGPGTYRMTRDGVEVWSATLPYTLAYATVADDGTVAGYGYTLGIEGFYRGEEANAEKLGTGSGDLVVAVLAPDGRPRVERRTARESSRFLHAAPTPTASIVCLDSEADRAVFVVDDPDLNRNDDEWQVYQLSTGKQLAVVHPIHRAGPNVRGLTDVRAVPGTCLAIAQWSTWTDAPYSSGARFTLLDAEWNVVWTLDRPHDHEVKGVSSPYRYGIDSKAPRQFSLRLVQQNQRATYSVRPDKTAEGGWAVREERRDPFVDPGAAVTAPKVELPRIELRALGPIGLGRAPTTQPVRGMIREFGVDDRGRLGFVRHDRGAASVVFVAADGTLIREVHVPGYTDGGAARTTLTPLRDGRWLATASGYGDDAIARAWQIDVESGVSAPIGVGFTAPPVDKVAGTADGGFVVLTRWDRRSLIRFDRDGRELWRIRGNSGKDDKVFSPNDVAVTGDGQVAVIDTIRGQVNYFNLDGGTFIRTLDLSGAFGRKPSYPNGLSADVAGGILVHDFASPDDSVWRVSRAGEVLGHFRPHFADGRTFRTYDAPQGAPDGKRWTTDGDCLLRLDRTGVVDRVLGEPPRPEALTEVSAVTLDPAGRIFAVAARTGAVHVFEPDGRPVRVCVPDPTDFPSDARPKVVTVDATGNAYVLSERERGDSRVGYVRFDATGRRTGVVPLGVQDVRAEWHNKPGSDERWVRGFRDVYLIGANGKRVRTVSRHADRTWFDTLDAIGVAPDGGLAVVSGTLFRVGSGPRVSLYTPTGEPIRTIPSADGTVFEVGYDGRNVFMACTDGLRITSARTGKTRLFVPPAHVPNQVIWHPVVSRDGRELLLMASSGARIDRYAMPEDE